MIIIMIIIINNDNNDNNTTTTTTTNNNNNGFPFGIRLLGVLPPPAVMLLYVLLYVLESIICNDILYDN